jgi:glucose-1-phosphate thymidylyltransferase
VACLEEIAWRQGWLDQNSLERQCDRHGKSSYGTYLRRLIDEELVNNP